MDEEKCVYQATIVLQYNSTLCFCFLKDEFTVLRLKIGSIALDYEQSLFFLCPSGKTRETLKVRENISAYCLSETCPQ